MMAAAPPRSTVTGMRPARPRRRRGISMIELIMVLALMGAVAALAAPALTGFARTGDDTTAKLYLTTTVDSEAFHHARTGTFAVVTPTTPNPLPGLMGDAAGALALVAGDTPATGANVSAAVNADGTVLGLATKPGDTCWLAVRNAAATGTTPTTIYAYSAAGQTPCTGQAALGLPATLNLASGFGRSPGSPAVAP